jgi:hypothetical protein
VEKNKQFWTASVFLVLLAACLRTSTGGTCCWEFWARETGNRKESWS